MAHLARTAFVVGLLTSVAVQAQRPATPASRAEASPQLWPRAASPSTISDAATERRIDEMIARMTVEQKVGQTIQADISAITPADLATYPLGSILAGGNSGPFGDERANSARWAELVSQYRAASSKPQANGLVIPVLFGVDAVHGHSNLPNATIFPHNIALGAARDPALIRKIGAATAAEVSASGIEWTFAPTLAVPQDLRWGRSYEGYAADPALVARYSREMTLGLQGDLTPGRPLAADRVAATPKHFLADGGTDAGKDQGDALVSEAELIRLHAQGYPPAIDAGALTVMISFSGWQGIKHHGNRSLMTGVLKERMGFKGLIVGDWNAHGQVEGCTTTRCPQALNAGLDLFMAPDSWKGLYENTIADVRAGAVPMARLDDAVRRILRVKAKLGLLDGQRPVRSDPQIIGSPAHRAIAREAVAKSLVLLKNEGGALPIRAGARVLVAGDGADNMAKQAGGWTITWQGTDTSKKDFTNGQTIFDGIAQAVQASGGTATLDVGGNFAEKPDVAIVVFGEAPYAEFQGDVATLDYQPQGASDLALVKKLKAAGVKVVSLFLSGRPMFTSPEMNSSDAFVAAWLPGSEGGGVADVLVAGRNGRTARDFVGKLPFAWPRDARSPLVRPLFATGYGLSYARPGRVGALSEAPGVDVAEALNVERYFLAGRALAPWTMSVSDAGGSRPVVSGIVRSPAGAVEVRPIDVAAQEDARLVSWTGKGSVSIDGPTVDLDRQLTGAFALVLDVIVRRRPASPATIAIANQPLPANNLLARDGAVTIKVPLRCFADKGANFRAVGNALNISSDGAMELVIRRAQLEPVGEPIACPS